MILCMDHMLEPIICLMLLSWSLNRICWNAGYYWNWFLIENNVPWRSNSSLAALVCFLLHFSPKASCLFMCALLNLYAPIEKNAMELVLSVRLDIVVCKFHSFIHLFHFNLFKPELNPSIWEWIHHSHSYSFPSQSPSKFCKLTFFSL